MPLAESRIPRTVWGGFETEASALSLQVSVSSKWGLPLRSGSPRGWVDVLTAEARRTFTTGTGYA
jgi:hypothetical protein